LSIRPPAGCPLLNTQAPPRGMAPGPSRPVPAGPARSRSALAQPLAAQGLAGPAQPAGQL